MKEAVPTSPYAFLTWRETNLSFFYSLLLRLARDAHKGGEVKDYFCLRISHKNQYLAAIDIRMVDRKKELYDSASF
jgi:hypothetical protein